MFSERIREVAYWSLDRVKGSRVKKHLRDIEYQMENLSDGRARKLNDENLTKLLSYVREKVEFYKNIKTSSLEAFPVINKNIIKENYAKFRSPDFSENQTVIMHTGGSTGTPFEVIQNQDKRNRVLAEMMYFWGKAGYTIGMRYVFFRVWNDINRKSKISAFSRNLVMIDILDLSEGNLENIRKRLKKDKKIKMLLGYASTLEALAQYLTQCDDKPEMFSVKTIISGSEVLTEQTRSRLISVFGSSVVSLYSNQENGMLAIECRENKEFHLNTASFKFEFLKMESEEPAEIGELCRIVVTDLFNFAMPIIRYDTGDVGILKGKNECEWKTDVLSSVQGRALDFIYDTSGKRISPLVVSNKIWSFDRLKQFQIIQEGQKKYVLKLNGSREFYEDNEFIDLFTEVLGKDAEIMVEHVDEIPILNSGKRKAVVCQYKRD